MPITAARWIDGPPPASGTYAATSAIASQRRAVRPRPAAVAIASTSVASSRTFAPLAATRCASPVARKSSRTSSVRAPSWPSTIPRASAPCGGGRPVVSARSVRSANAVERPEHAAAAPAGGADRLRAQERVGVAAALVRVERPERREPAVDRELGARLGRARPRHVRGGSQQDALAAPGAGLEPDRRDARAEGACARVLEEGGPDVDRRCR